MNFKKCVDMLFFVIAIALGISVTVLGMEKEEDE